MDRRAFLETSAAGIVAVGSGCAGRIAETHSPRRIPPEQVLSRLEAGMRSIDQGRLLGRIAPSLRAPRSPAARVHVDEGEAYARKTMQALLYAGLVRELDPAVQRDPRLSAWDERLAPVMDEAMTASYGLVARASSADHERLQKALRADPGLPMRLAAKLDVHAGELGVSGRSRASLRGAAAGLGFRLRRQPPGLVLGEIRSKVERVAARDGAELARRRARVGTAVDQSIWQSRRSGGIVMIVGGSLLGLGAIVAGLGNDDAGSVTAGVLLGLAGIVCLIVGLVIFVASDE